MSSADVLEIAQRHLAKVKRSGPDNIMAVCPFHSGKAGSVEEKNPSFTMSLSRGLYYCFSCHERGTLDKFLREIGMSRERITMFYGDLLVELDTFRPPPADPLRPTRIVEEPLPEPFLGLFDYCPPQLLDEGFEEATLRLFDVGFDTKNQRITYPLRDWDGTLVGISGRSLDGSWPRYKVYDTEYEGFGLKPRKTKKAGILWNCHRVLPEVYFCRDSAVVAVEGFKACMWLHQAGIRTTVALLGSFMSKEQLWLLTRMGAEIYLMLDNDQAGLKGRNMIAREIARHAPVRIVTYDADQPSDLEPNDIESALCSAQRYELWKLNQLPTTA